MSSLINDPDVLHDQSPKSSATLTNTFDLAEIQRTQIADPIIGKIYSFVKTNKRPAASQRQNEPPDVRLFLHEWPEWFIGKDGVLRRKIGA